jgi:hypothetical protein
LYRPGLSRIVIKSGSVVEIKRSTLVKLALASSGGAGSSSVSRRGPVTIAGSQSNYDVALFTVCFFVAFDYGARMHRNQWADNSSFAISGSNLITRGTIAREPYAVSISAT